MSDKFEVGDMVQIRQWDEMANEFGLDDDGDICCENTFAKNMKPLCGQIAIISDMCDDIVYLDFLKYKECVDYVWTFSVDMIEHAKEKIVIYQDKDFVVAVDNATGNKAKASCEDEYIGAKLAIERLAELKSKLHVGDMVKITDPGRMYTTYTEWVCDYISDKNLVARYAYGQSLEDGSNDVFTIIHIAPHGSTKETLAYIGYEDQYNCFNECHLIGIDGLQKVLGSEKE